MIFIVDMLCEKSSHYVYTWYIRDYSHTPIAWHHRVALLATFKSCRRSVHPYGFFPVFHGASPVIIATAVWCLIHPQVELPVRARVLFPLYRGDWLLHLFVCRFINEGRPVNKEHTTPQTMLIELRLVVTLTTFHPSLSVHTYQNHVYPHST